MYASIMLSSNEIFIWKFTTVIQVLDVVIFGGMLVLFRPRIFPPFFSLGINEL
jgi:hypothetical protein